MAHPGHPPFTAEGRSALHNVEHPLERAVATAHQYEAAGESWPVHHHEAEVVEPEPDVEEGDDEESPKGRHGK